MIKLKNIGKETLIARFDGISDVFMMTGDTHEFENAVAEQLMVIHAPNLVKVIEVPFEHQDETEESKKVTEVEEVPVMKEKIVKKIKKIVKKIKKGKK